ncbi:MAG: putative Ig domain-containing protein [Fimbriimonadaceae bacterium]|nr:putative Ig domain-containing protein [Fimbriimonadaceae bacterium]
MLERAFNMVKPRPIVPSRTARVAKSAKRLVPLVALATLGSLANGQPIWAISDFTRIPSATNADCARIAADGRLAVRANDGRSLIFDSLGRIVHEFDGASDFVNSIAPDAGRYIGRRSGVWNVINLANDTIVRDLPDAGASGNERWILSADGKYALTAADDTTLYLARSDAAGFLTLTTSAAGHFGFSRNGSWFWSVNPGTGNWAVRRSTTGNLVRSGTAGVYHNAYAAVTDDGHYLISFATGSNPQVVDLNSGAVSTIPVTAKGNPILGALASGAGWLVCGYQVQTPGGQWRYSIGKWSLLGEFLGDWAVEPFANRGAGVDYMGVGGVVPSGPLACSSSGDRVFVSGVQSTSGSGDKPFHALLRDGTIDAIIEGGANGADVVDSDHALRFSRDGASLRRNTVRSASSIPTTVGQRTLRQWSDQAVRFAGGLGGYVTARTDADAARRLVLCDASGNVVRTFMTFVGDPTGLEVSPDGATCATAQTVGGVGTLSLFDVQTGTSRQLSIADLGASPAEFGNRLCFSPEGTLLAVVQAAGVSIVKVSDGTVASIATGAGTRAVAWERGSGAIWVLNQPAGAVGFRRYNAVTGALLQTIPVPAGWTVPPAIDVSPDGKTLAFCWSTTGEPTELRLMDVATGTVLHALPVQPGEGGAAAISPEGWFVAAAGDHQTVVWENPVNEGPVLDPIADRAVESVALLTFAAHATDANGDQLRYSLEGAPAGAAIDPTTGVFTWTPTDAQVGGPYPITVVVSEYHMGRTNKHAERTFQVTVAIGQVEVGGKLTLTDYNGPVNGLQATISLGGGLENHVVTLDAQGRFKFNTYRRGRFDISAVSRSWLRRRVSGLDITSAGGTRDLTLLYNGDINGNNTINIQDFLALRAAFGSTPGAANWNPLADVDGNGSVGVSDFLIVRRNFGRTGQ